MRRLEGGPQAGLHLNRLLNAASVLNRFRIEAPANDQTVLELEERDAAHVEGLAGGVIRTRLT
jgi:hypothetical protein